MADKRISELNDLQDKLWQRLKAVEGRIKALESGDPIPEIQKPLLDKPIRLAKAAWELEDAFFHRALPEAGEKDNVETVYPTDIMKARKAHVKFLNASEWYNKAIVALVMLTFLEVPPWCHAKHDEMKHFTWQAGSDWCPLPPVPDKNSNPNLSGVPYLPPGYAFIIELIIEVVILYKFWCEYQLEKEHFVPLGEGKSMRNKLNNLGFLFAIGSIVDTGAFVMFRIPFRFTWLCRSGLIFLLPGVQHIFFNIFNKTVLTEFGSVAMFFIGTMVFFAWIGLTVFQSANIFSYFEGEEKVLANKGFTTFADSMNTMFVGGVTGEFIDSYLPSYQAYRGSGVVWMIYLLLTQVLFKNLVMDTLISAYLQGKEAEEKKTIERQTRGMRDAFNLLATGNEKDGRSIEKEDFIKFCQVLGESPRWTEFPPEAAELLYNEFLAKACLMSSTGNLIKNQDGTLLANVAGGEEFEVSGNRDDKFRLKGVCLDEKSGFFILDTDLDEDGRRTLPGGASREEAFFVRTGDGSLQIDPPGGAKGDRVYVIEDAAGRLTTSKTKEASTLKVEVQAEVNQENFINACVIWQANFWITKRQSPLKLDEKPKESFFCIIDNKRVCEAVWDPKPKNGRDTGPSSFDQIMNTILCFNLIMVLIESVYDIWNIPEPQILDTIEICFSFVYLGEVSIKLCVQSFSGYWSRPANKFDFLTTWLLLGTSLLKFLPIAALKGDLARYANILRLLRLVRIIKQLKKFKQVQFMILVITRIMTCAGEVLELMGTFFFFFANLAMNLFGGLLHEGNEALEGSEYAEKHWYVFNFNDMFMSFMTWFVQILCEYVPNYSDALRRTASAEGLFYGPVSGMIVLFFYITTAAIMYELLLAFTVDVFMEVNDEENPEEDPEVLEEKEEEEKEKKEADGPEESSESSESEFDAKEFLMDMQKEVFNDNQEIVHYQIKTEKEPQEELKEKYDKIIEGAERKLKEQKERGEVEESSAKSDKELEENIIKAAWIFENGVWAQNIENMEVKEEIERLRQKLKEAQEQKREEEEEDEEEEAEGDQKAGEKDELDEEAIKEEIEKLDREMGDFPDGMVDVKQAKEDHIVVLGWIKWYYKSMWALVILTLWEVPAWCHSNKAAHLSGWTWASGIDWCRAPVEGANMNLSGLWYLPPMVALVIEIAIELVVMKRFHIEYVMEQTHFAKIRTRTTLSTTWFGIIPKSWFGCIPTEVEGPLYRYANQANINIGIFCAIGSIIDTTYFAVAKDSFRFTWVFRTGLLCLLPGVQRLYVRIFNWDMLKQFISVAVFFIGTVLFFAWIAVTVYKDANGIAFMNEEEAVHINKGLEGLRASIYTMFLAGMTEGFDDIFIPSITSCRAAAVLWLIFLLLTQVLFLNLVIDAFVAAYLDNSEKHMTVTAHNQAKAVFNASRLLFGDGEMPKATFTQFMDHVGRSPRMRKITPKVAEHIYTEFKKQLGDEETGEEGAIDKRSFCDLCSLVQNPIWVTQKNSCVETYFNQSIWNAGWFAPIYRSVWPPEEPKDEEEETPEDDQNAISKWMVECEGGVNIRKDKSRTSEILPKRNNGEGGPKKKSKTVFGTEQNGWIKLEYQPGFMMIRDGGEILMKKCEMEAKENEEEASEEEKAPFFDEIMDTVLVFNLFFVVSQSFAAKDYIPEWMHLSTFFTLIYLFEVGVKLMVKSWATYWSDPSNQFDFFTTWLLFGTWSLKFINIAGLQQDLQKYANILRLLRLLRVMKKLKKYKRFQFMVSTVVRMVDSAGDILALLGVCLFFFTTFSVNCFGGLLYEGNKKLEGSDYNEKHWYVFNFNDVPMAFGTWFTQLLCEYAPEWADALNRVSSVGDYAWYIYPTFYIIGVAIVFEILKAFTIETYIALKEEKDEEDEEEEAKKNKKKNQATGLDTPSESSEESEEDDEKIRHTFDDEYDFISKVQDKLKQKNMLLHGKISLLPALTKAIKEEYKETLEEGEEEEAGEPRG